ncbi:MAG: GH3 auxin-responsive promoter family protein [Proteobacteria bacterium]|nr:GH3 auxin-responsive promoter family protein [Pseudomonadota bacterium]
MNVSPSVSSKVSSLAFRLLYAMSLKGTKDFEYSMDHLESVQRKKLTQLLHYSENKVQACKYNLHSTMSYEEFAKRVPLTKYPDWESFVLEQKNTGSPSLTRDTCDRYQPTSGSSSKMKWIPYTPSFLTELDSAISPMLVNVFKNNPRILKGKHYWSLSWIPTHLRTKISPDANDDMKLLPWWKRLFMSITMAVPNEISFAATSEGSIISSIAHLLSCKDLSMISVWSPTFAINLFEQMARHREELSEILAKGDWGDRRQELFHIPCPRSPFAANILDTWNGEVGPDFLKTIWPDMALISSWDTSSSRIWAQELQRLFPDAAFLAKGLWSTEGVVTIPYQGKYPLAATSHFYEFIDHDTQRIHAPWDLKKGQIVRPLLTTGSGFFRYDLNDQVRVSDFLRGCPCFEFLGRGEGIDMIGEKLTPKIASEVIRKACDTFQIRALTLLASPGSITKGEKPRYHLLCEAQPDDQLKKKITQFTSLLLEESFHYKLATEIGQLNPVNVVLHPDCRKIYQERNEKRGMILGDMKIEPLVLWDESDAEYFQRLSLNTRTL